MAAGVLAAQQPSQTSSMLSGAQAPGGKLLDIEFYGEILGVYDSGLLPAGGAGNAPGAAYGTESGLGASISRRWRHAGLAMEYKGRFREYANQPLWNGSEQYFTLLFREQFARHVALSLAGTAGTTTTATGSMIALGGANSGLFALPTDDVFDIRTNYADSTVNLIWRIDPHLSLDLGAEGFVVRRDSFELAGLDGYRAHAVGSYRFSAHQTMLAAYEHTYFDFQRVFGDTALETAYLGYSVQITRTLDLSLEAGGSRVATVGLGAVAIDPAIAAIIGRSTALVVQHQHSYAPLLNARMVEHLRNGTLRLGVFRSMSPGNGAALTSRQSAITLGYSYAGHRDLAVSVNASFTTLSPMAQGAGTYSSFSGGAGVTYRLIRETHLELRYDFRHFTTQNFFSKKDSSRVTLGLAYGSGEAPLAVH
jgi:hypothetical protein